MWLWEFKIWSSFLPGKHVGTHWLSVPRGPTGGTGTEVIGLQPGTVACLLPFVACPLLSVVVTDIYGKK